MKEKNYHFIIQRQLRKVQSGWRSALTVDHSDSRQGCMDELQKVRYKLFRLLNNTRISEKINTKTIAVNLNMLSVNQINGQVKLFNGVQKLIFNFGCEFSPQQELDFIFKCDIFLSSPMFWEKA